jgi:hypothetical protein
MESRPLRAGRGRAPRARAQVSRRRLHGRVARPLAPEEAIADRVLRVGLVAAVVGVAAQTVAHATNEIFWDSRFDPLSADVDWSIFSWASSVATFAGALAASVIAAAVPRTRRRFAVLAVLLVFFSLDDIAQAHENVAGFAVDVLDTASYVGRLLWELIYAPILLLAFVLLWLSAQEAPARPRRSIQYGLALLVAAVVGEGAMTLWFAAGGERGSWPHVAEVTLEEGAELAGWIAISSGLLAVAAVRLFRLGTRFASTD